MDEMNKLPEDQNNVELMKQENTAPESAEVSEPTTEVNEPIAEMPALKAPIPKLPLIIGGVVAGVAAIAIVVATILGGGSHKHSYGAWNIVDKPTCLSAGIEERVCECGENDMRRIDALGHKEVIDSAVNPTCTSAGLTEGKHCSECHAVINAQENIPMVAHTYDNEHDDECNICGYKRETECAHAEIETIIGKEATCMSTGLTDGAKCKDCGETIVEQATIPMVAHTYDNEYDDECNICGHKHDAECAHAEIETIIGKEATCTSTGLTNGTRCKDCGETIVAQSLVPIVAHSYDNEYDDECNICGHKRDAECSHTETTVIPGKAATCTATGITDGFKCNKCGEIIAVQTTIPQVAHTESSIPAVGATCTATGLTEGKRCSVCLTVLVSQTVVPMKAHTEVTDAAVAATCTSTGLTEGKHCFVCLKVIVEQQETQKIAHTYTDRYDESCNNCGFIRDVECVHAETETINGYAATCTSAGLTDGTKCKKCGEIIAEQIAISMIPHTEVVDPAISATCTSTGLTEGKHCSVCNKMLVAQETVSIKPHTEIVDVGVEATCINGGLTDGKHCSVCGTTTLAHEMVPALGHIEVVDAFIPATCTTNGKTAGKHCSRCNEILVGQSTISALGHVEVADASVPATCTKDGKTEGKHCSRCNEILIAQSTIPAGHLKENVSIVSKSCLQETATISYTCIKCSLPVNEELSDIDIKYSRVEWGTMWGTSGTYNYATFSINATGGYGDYQYRFEVYNSRYAMVADLTKDYSANNTFAFQSTGSLTNALLKVYVRDNYGNESWVKVGVGNVYTIEKGVKEATHIYSSVVTIPTKYEGGYTTHICSECNDTYKDTYVPAIGSDGLAYTVNADNKSCTITGIGTCTDTHVAIPTVIDGYKVTAIANRAFYECTVITEITIPETITSIGTQIFYKAENLHTVYYNSSYSSQDNNFLNISSINKVVFGGKIVPEMILVDCSNVKFVEIANSVTKIALCAFKNCTALEVVSIPDSVTSIGFAAFSGCSSLKNVVIPNAVTKISANLFYGCTSLVSITIPDSVVNIGGSAFYNCSSLSSIIIPDSISNIENDTFSYCSSLTSIVIPDSVRSIGMSAFSYCSSLTSIVIPDSVGNIGSSAFSNCSALISIVIPDSVGNIGSSAFSHCSSLEKIDIPTSVTSIESFAFYDCSSLKKIDIPTSVTSIGRFAFSDCSSLENITIPTSVTSIGQWAFYNCYSLKSITLPNSIINIEDHTFQDCHSLESIKLPDFLVSIGRNAFLDCLSLKSITIPVSVTNIGKYAFSGCESLTQIIIPCSVTSIGECAFHGCMSLRKIYCEVASKPDDWDSDWNATWTSKIPVVWAYTQN